MRRNVAVAGLVVLVALVAVLLGPVPNGARPLTPRPSPKGGAEPGDGGGGGDGDGRRGEFADCAWGQRPGQCPGRTAR